MNGRKTKNSFPVSGGGSDNQGIIPDLLVKRLLPKPWHLPQFLGFGCFLILLAVVIFVIPTIISLWTK